MLNKHDTRFSFEALAVVMFQVEVFWVVTPCSVVVGYQRFRAEDGGGMGTSETLVHGFRTQKTWY
jgi:hypothetical protein